jgi:hypothetical protein
MLRALTLAAALGCTLLGKARAEDKEAAPGARADSPFTPAQMGE